MATSGTCGTCGGVSVTLKSGTCARCRGERIHAAHGARGGVYATPKIAGEITVGGSIHRNAQPRIIGADNVSAFKSRLGVCPAHGCAKIDGHEGDCRK